VLKYSRFCYRKGLLARLTPKRLEGEDLAASERFASILIAFSCRRSALAFLLAVLPTFLASASRASYRRGILPGPSVPVVSRLWNRTLFTGRAQLW
jgi:hypothetical protein